MQADPAVLEPNQVWLSEGLAGRWTLSGNLQHDVGAMLNGLLQQGFERLSRARRDGDVVLEGHDPSMLRGEAFADLVGNALRVEPGAKSAPDRYRATVVITTEQLARSPITVCDSTMFRMLVDAKGAIIDVGRDTRLWNISQRRGFDYRDGGCVFPGCDRPPSWCDIHHCRHWRHGGETNMNNGALLCRRHHVFLHAALWYIEIINGKPVVHTDTGQPYQPKRWAASREQHGQLLLTGVSG